MTIVVYTFYYIIISGVLVGIRRIPKTDFSHLCVYVKKNLQFMGIRFRSNIIENKKKKMNLFLDKHTK